MIKYFKLKFIGIEAYHQLYQNVKKHKAEKVAARML